MRTIWNLGLATAGMLAACVLAAPAAAQDELYDPYGTWNGYRVYLSPARHTDAGGRGECGGNNENDMAYSAAWTVATGDNGYDLRSRGYKVRIGRGTLQSAIDNSNAWAAHVHVPMHSNADVTGQCARTDASRFGTVGIYWSSSANSKALTSSIHSWLAPNSPGTHDYTCYNPGDPCTTITLGELRYTSATAAYIESEFHTWNNGITWLKNPYDWGWLVAGGIDEYLGYP